MYAGHFDFSQRLLWTVPDLFGAQTCQELLAEPTNGCRPPSMPPLVGW
jgi:hypothetical protein